MAVRSANSTMDEFIHGAARVFLKPIVPLLDDPTVTEIMINGPDQIYIERKGKIQKTDIVFRDRQELESAANIICQYVNKQLKPENPRVDARLPDGSRVHIIAPPVCHNGICVSIRRFPDKPLTGEDLLQFGSITKDVLDFLSVCVEMHLNLVVSGGTGSGKTSLLNVLARYIDNNERVLVIEDTSELQLAQDHVVRLEARPPDEKGKGQVTIRNLFHSALRMRPDRVVIGEVRDREALDLIQAMTSGHSGCLTTVHATTPADALCRLETLCLYADTGLPLHAVRAQVASAINLVVQTARLRDGTRKVTEIAEILPLKPDGNYNYIPLFRFTFKGLNKDETIMGELLPMGNKPSFLSEARNQGYNILPEHFETT